MFSHSKMIKTKVVKKGNIEELSQYYRQFFISKLHSDTQYLCKIGIEYHERKPNGFLEEFPFAIVFDFGDFPIVLKRSRNQEQIIKEFQKIMKQSNLKELI